MNKHLTETILSKPFNEVMEITKRMLNESFSYQKPIRPQITRLDSVPTGELDTVYGAYKQARLDYEKAKPLYDAALKEHNERREEIYDEFFTYAADHIIKENSLNVDDDGRRMIKTKLYLSKDNLSLHDNITEITNWAVRMYKDNETPDFIKISNMKHGDVESFGIFEVRRVYDDWLIYNAQHRSKIGVYMTAESTFDSLSHHLKMTTSF